MKILMAGDIHGSLEHGQYLLNEAREQQCDRVLQCGDFGFWPHYPEGVTFLDQLNLYANLRNIVFYWIDGNHDKTSRIYEDYGLPDGTLDPQYLDAEGFVKVRDYVRYAPRGHRWTWDGCRFIALGGAYSLDKKDRLDKEKRMARAHLEVTNEVKSFAGYQWFPEEEMTDEEMGIILSNEDQVDVIVAHDKPRGANPRWNRKNYPECFPNQDNLQSAVRVLEPLFYYHGHLHYPYEDVVAYSAFLANNSEPRYVHVIGLSCDARAGAYERGYHPIDSRRVFDTEEVKGVARPS